MFGFKCFGGKQDVIVLDIPKIKKLFFMPPALSPHPTNNSRSHLLLGVRFWSKE